jgi:hypothetical protein
MTIQALRINMQVLTMERSVVRFQSVYIVTLVTIGWMAHQQTKLAHEIEPHWLEVNCHAV